METTQDATELTLPTARKTASVLLVAGAIIFMVANTLHPRSPDIEVYEEQITTVANSDLWIVNHLVLLGSNLMIIIGLIAWAATLTGVAAFWGRLGNAAALMAGGLGSTLWALDGITSKFVHDAYDEAPAEEASVALRVSEMMEEIDVGLFSVFIIVFFGVMFLLYGQAARHTPSLPSWTGPMALVLAVVSLVLGTVQAIDGLSTLVTSQLFVVVSSFLSIWLIVVGVYLWKARRAETA